MNSRPQRRWLFAPVVACGLVAAPLVALPASAAPDGSGVVIAEAYATGGSAEAPFVSKFVELANPTADDVELDGWSVQYRSATGTGAPTGLVELDGVIPAGGSHLVGGASNGSTGAELPTPDASGGTLNLAVGGGTVILADTTERLTLPAGDNAGADGVVDLLGYGTSNTFEVAAGPTVANTRDHRSIARTDAADSDDNAADFTLSDDVTPTNAAGEQGEPTPAPEPEPLPEPTPDPEGAVEIAEIQGTGAESPLAGQTVTTSGVVTAAYPEGGFDGYYLQTPGTGGAIDLAEHDASDAVFVYSPETVGAVAIGQHVQVTGAVSEHFGATQVSVRAESGLVALDEPAEAPAPAEVAFPATDEERERLEGMVIAPAGDYTVTDTYDTNRFGTIGLAASDAPLLSPGVAGAPGTAEAEAELDRAAAELVLLDDGASRNYQNATSTPLPYLSTERPVRVGAAVEFQAPVILDFRYDSWGFQPLEPVTGDTAEADLPAAFEDTRDAEPADVGGAVGIATFNVLNYFTTTGDALPGCTFYTDRDGTPITVNRGCDARGAATPESLERQEAKIVEAINGLGADVVSLEEIENSAAFGKDRDEALNGLVAALNADAGAGTWEAVASPDELPADEDVIRTAFIYRAAAVETVGESRILVDSDNFDNAREPNAQAFAEVGAADAEPFVVIGNHFKSKGGSGEGDNADAGAGGFNGDRVRQAEDLVGFADEVAEDAGTEDVFLVGDFNSYAAEDPIQAVLAAGYTDIGAKTGKHTYAFGGAVGSLDYVFASESAAAKVTGQDIWNINSPESIALEYSRFNANVSDLYDASAFRSSDHDPVIVGFDPGAEPSLTTSLNLLNINDFHGRIDENTVKFAGTVEQLRAAFPDTTAFLSAGDNIGASLFASAIAEDNPTIDVLNALELLTSAVGNHEFDQGMDDLTGRVADRADFSYLGANVVDEATGEPALQEYELVELDGITVGVIGVVTDETPTLVSPEGVDGLRFDDPVDAVNRVAAQLTDGDAANGEADVLVAEFHEGAGAGTAEDATLEEEVAGGGVFAKIVTETAPEVDAIFTGHTHKEYVWDAPVPGADGETRPIVQTGSYGERVGQIVLEVERASGDVVDYEARNVERIAANEDADLEAEEQQALADEFPRVAEVQRIVEAALAEAEVIGGTKIAEVDAPITRAKLGDNADDRASESTLGNFVANMLRDTLSTDELGGAEIGVANPGGLRADLAEGDLTYAEANAVLPFVNNLWTTTLTGEQFTTLLEQQWQNSEADGSGETPSRPYLQLGLSDNVEYTFDAENERGERITSVTVDGAPIDPEREYRIGTFSFLVQGGDNFHAFADGTDARDSGLVDRDGWIAAIAGDAAAQVAAGDDCGPCNTISPSYDRRSVQVEGLPTAPVSPGETIELGVSKLDLTSAGVPTSTELTALLAEQGAAEGDARLMASGADVEGDELASFPIVDDAAEVSVRVPEGADGDYALRLVADASGTIVTIPLTVDADAEPGEPGTPGGPGAPGSDAGTPGGSAADDGDASGDAAGSGLAATGAQGLAALVALALLLLGAAASVLIVRARRAA